MAPPLAVPAALLSAILLFPTLEMHADIDVLLQERNVCAVASAEDYYSGESDYIIEGISSTDEGPFVVDVGVTVSIPGGSAGCSAIQDSLIFSGPTAPAGYVRHWGLRRGQRVRGPRQPRRVRSLRSRARAGGGGVDPIRVVVGDPVPLRRALVVVLRSGS